MKSNFFKRIALWLSLIGLTILAGCNVKEVKVNPVRTQAMVTWTVGTGVGGTNTTRTDTCTFPRQASEEEAVEIETSPRVLVERNFCKEFAKEEVWASEPFESVVAKTAVSAAFGNIGNVLATRWLDKKRFEDCEKAGGCGTKIVNNVLAVAEGGKGGAGGHGGNGGNSASLAVNQNENNNTSTVGVGVDVSVQGSGSNDGGGCKTTGCK